MKSKYIFTLVLVLALYPTAIFGQMMFGFDETSVEIMSLTPDKLSPQPAGTAITWTAEVSNPGGADLVYKFELKGPGTSGRYDTMRDCSSSNTWTWRPREADVGKNNVMVEVSDLSLMKTTGDSVITTMTSILDVDYTIAPTCGGTISGYVRDATTGDVIPFAMLYCKDALCYYCPTTDEEGYYEFDKCLCPLTDYTIECAADGYEYNVEDVITDINGNAWNVNFDLELGTHEFVVVVVDSLGNTVEGAEIIVDGLNRGTTNDRGELEVQLIDGSHAAIAFKAGYTTRSWSGDLDHNVDKSIGIILPVTKPEIEDFNVVGGLGQYEGEYKYKVFRRGQDRPTFDVTASVPKGSDLVVEIIKDGEVKATLDTQAIGCAINSKNYIYIATWDWKSNNWNKIPDDIPVGEYGARAKIIKNDGAELVNSEANKFYTIFDYAVGNGFIEAKNAFAISFDTKRATFTYPINQYNALKFENAINEVDGETSSSKSSSVIAKYAYKHPHPPSPGEYTYFFGIWQKENKWPQCRHYAWSMVEYCRAIGIPARFLWAYGDWNGVLWNNKAKDHFTHGFVEVNDKQDGWIQYDPTWEYYIGQFGRDNYAKVGVECRPEKSGYWVSGATKVNSDGTNLNPENIYDRYTFCADAMEIEFINPPYDYGQNITFDITVKNNGAIPIDTPVHVRVFDVPTNPFLEQVLIDDVVITNSLTEQGESERFSYVLPDYGALNNFYKNWERDVKVVVYYLTRNVEIETSELSERIPGLCISPVQSIAVDNVVRSITNASLTRLNQTDGMSWRKETYVPDVPAIVDIYSESDVNENYSKVVVSIENPDSVGHNYKYLAQLAGMGDAIFVPELGIVNSNLTGLNISTDYFIAYHQNQGTGDYISIYKFSKNATIEGIQIINYEGVSLALVNATWDQILSQESSRDFSIYFSIRNGGRATYSDINAEFGKEIVGNGDSLTDMVITVAPLSKVGDVKPINISISNNGEVSESSTIQINVTKIIYNIPIEILSLYNNTARVTVQPKTEEVITFMVPVSEYTKSGLWYIDVMNEKGLKAKSAFRIDDAFDLNCTQSIKAEPNSEFIFNVSVTNVWDTSVHDVNISIELQDYFNTSDPVEVYLGDLMPGENITVTWRLNATSSGLRPIVVRVDSDDGGYDTIESTVMSLSGPSLWIPTLVNTAFSTNGTGTLPIKLEIYNVGDSNATNVSANIILPENVTATDVAWNIGNLTGGESASIYTNVTFTKPEDFVISTSASYDANNSVSGLVYVNVISNLSANFSDVYSDYGSDLNLDGIYEDLMIEVGLNVMDEGSCNVEGWLCDDNGTSISKAKNSSYLSTGNHSVILSFDGKSIYKHGMNGTFNLTNISLYGKDNTLIASIPNAYTTKPYNYSEFQPLVMLVGNYSDYGTDIDGNGLFENLTVDVGLILAKEGKCAITASLVDSINEKEIARASNTTSLFANQLQLIQLNFNGDDIYNNTLNGTYYVRDVFVYHTADPTQSEYVYNAYTTSAYNYTDFEY